MPSQLKKLVSRVPEGSPFIKRHGRLLGFVTSGFKEDMISVLFQFFDPTHHCFTFPDYQLVPTMEEFSELLGILVLDRKPFIGLEKDPQHEEIAAAIHQKQSDIVSNWGKRSGVKSFLAKFLLEKARLWICKLLKKSWLL